MSIQIYPIGNTSVNSSALTFSSSNLRITNAIYYTIGSLGLVLNVFTIAVIYLYKPLHKQITIVFIVNQSILDALASFFLLISTVYPNDYARRTQGNIADEALCRIWFTQLPMWSLLVSSIYGIVALTFERFIAVVYPLWHKAHFSNRKIGFIVACIWLIGIVYNFPTSIATSGLSKDGVCSVYGTYTSPQTAYLSGVIRYFIEFCSPLILLSCFYAKMVSTLRRKVGPLLNIGRSKRAIETNASVSSMQTIQVHSSRCVEVHSMKSADCNEPSLISTLTGHEEQEEAHGITESTPRSTGLRVGPHGASSDVIRQEPKVQREDASREESSMTVRARRNVIKTFILCDVGYALCWTWSETYIFIAHFPPITSNLNLTFFSVAIALEFLSCSINPVIYCSQYKQFQRGIKWIFTHKMKILCR